MNLFLGNLVNQFEIRRVIIRQSAAEPSDSLIPAIATPAISDTSSFLSVLRTLPDTITERFLDSLRHLKGTGKNNLLW